jgi:hypothetical protein
MAYDKVSELLAFHVKKHVDGTHLFANRLLSSCIRGGDTRTDTTSCVPLEGWFDWRQI